MSEQEDFLKRNRVDPRPQYFSTELQEDLTISADMEDYLILLPPADRDELYAKLEEAKLFEKEDSNIKELIALYKTNEDALADEKITPLKTTTESIVAFLPKLALQIDEPFVPQELSNVQKFIQIPTEAETFELDRQTHVKSFLDAITTLEDSDYEKEIDSWLVIIDIYKGAV